MPELVTLPQVKAYLNIGQSNTVHDTELNGLIAAAVEAIERYLGQIVVARPVDELHTATRRDPMLVLRRHPVTSLLDISPVDGGPAVDLDGLELEPETGIVWLLSGGLTGRVRVSYVAGPAQPSAAHQRAAEIIVGNLFEAQRIAGAGPAAGAVSADEQLVTDAYGVAIPPRARELLGPPTPMVG